MLTCLENPESAQQIGRLASIVGKATSPLTLLPSGEGNRGLLPVARELLRRRLLCGFLRLLRLWLNRRSRLRSGRLATCSAGVCVGFDLDHHVWVREPAHFDDGRCGRRVAKEFLVRASHFGKTRHVGDEHSRANHVMHREPRALERRANVDQRLTRLHVHLSCAYDHSALIGCRGARDRDHVAGAHQPRIADDRLPHCIGRDSRDRAHRIILSAREVSTRAPVYTGMSRTG